MVFVKVRETYDLHTTKNKMTVIAIHTPKPDIIKRNYPGLLMQCRSYRPKSCDVRLACASVLPLDPLGVGLTENDVAPEDVFNPILYRAMSNKGMSQLEARINYLSRASSGTDVDGNSAAVEVDGTTTYNDEFNVYYGLLADTRGWRHAHPQSGLNMTKLKPFVYEMVYNVGDQAENYLLGNINETGYMPKAPQGNGSAIAMPVRGILGKAKQMPFINCTSYTYTASKAGNALSGFTDDGTMISNCEQDVPYLPVVVAGIIVPPSRLHELFFRMVIEWTLEFSTIRSNPDITDWEGLARVGNAQHYQNYSYSATKEAITGDSSTILENDECMVSSNADIEKVM